MRYKTFDTHKYIKELEASGFKEAQAEVIINSLLASRDFDLGTLATREQFNHLQGDISLIKKDISILDSKIIALDEKMSDKISALDKKIDITISERIASLESKILK